MELVAERSKDNMAFSNQVKKQKYENVGGQCECTRVVCGHKGRCPAYLSMPVLQPQAGALAQLLGQVPAYSYPGFEFNHKLSDIAGGADTLANCEFMCVTCHTNTRSYGTNLTR